MAKPLIFIFSLGDDFMQSLLDSAYLRLVSKLALKSDLKIARNTKSAQLLLQKERTPQAIFITDCEIMDIENKVISDKLVEYANDGGTVVLGASFPPFAEYPTFNKYIKQQWKLDWSFGTHPHGTIVINEAGQRIPNKQLPQSFDQKVICINNVRFKEAWYLKHIESDDDSDDEAMNTETVNIHSSYDKVSSPVVFGSVGEGYLGFIGFANSSNSEECDAVVSAMLGLPVKYLIEI